jgi:hypothetical protein
VNSKLLSRLDAAAYLGIPVRTFDRHVAAKEAKR